MAEMLLTLICGAAIGLSLGLTGGGGSLFALPLLVYVLGLPLSDAVPASLLVVGITALLGSIDALRLKLVFLRPTLLFAVAGIATAPAGLWLGAHLPDTLRLAMFAALAALMGIRMGVSARNAGPATVRARLSHSDSGAPLCRYAPDGALRFSAPCAGMLLLGGCATGILSGIFGVGGGFLIVPILMATLKLPIARAIASSLVIITLISGSGALAAWHTLHQHYAMLLPFAAGSLLGMAGGRWLASRLPAHHLQRTFAAGLLLVAVLMFIRLM